MPDQVGITAKGGTMRLGKYPCVLAEGTLARAAYGAADISERHRHRYEFNNQFRRELQDAGLRLAGLSPDGHLVEIVSPRSELVCKSPSFCDKTVTDSGLRRCGSLRRWLRLKIGQS